MAIVTGMSTNAETFGTNVKRVRRGKIPTLSQVQLAELVGVSVQTITKIESGAGCRLDTAMSIADALDVSVEELWDGPTGESP